MVMIGEKLKALNRRKRMTQRKLSIISGVGRSTINEIEKGKNNNPRWKTVISLCKALKRTPNDLTDIDWEVE